MHQYELFEDSSGIIVDFRYNLGEAFANNLGLSLGYTMEKKLKGSKTFLYKVGLGEEKKAISDFIYYSTFVEGVYYKDSYTTELGNLEKGLLKSSK